MTESLLKVGAKAPEFALPDQSGDLVELSQFAGKPVVLFFYPKASTPGCTLEARDFTAKLGDFEAAGAVVIGVSKDSVKKQSNFAKKEELATALLSDAEGTVCEDYGVWGEKKMYGKTFMGIARTTYLIGPDGKIAQVWDKVKVDGHADDVLAAVRAL
ncbi:thioredoxin-dependent thiol peroxidase [Maritimibacter sp. DP1N21-5]|uniref:thioredoxin-dependent thiol peroxidase n=1 Tax=Maritimibacter sp. DP1N21-5 TaxID=2836867 RepID=UPI001C48F8DA|nr:thioredoxin-dependent thiol peroxidase [Maritimibacter sp. DP1N21-5]MBV7409771.1 thioredoxin-dependent thiol peroxidase [Maritimibacter sp. DP1N21-5]